MTVTVRQSASNANGVMFNGSLSENFVYEGRESSSSLFLGDSLRCGPCVGSFLNESLTSVDTSQIADIFVGNAFDIVIFQSDHGNLYQNSEFLVSFNRNGKYKNHKIVLELENTGDDEGIQKTWFPFVRRRGDEFHETNGNDSEDDNDGFEAGQSWGCCHPESDSVRPEKLSKSCHTTKTSTTGYNEQCNYTDSSDVWTNKLKPFLKPGRNPIRFLLLDHITVVGVAEANIYLWNHDDSIVVSDIDGTITKSNARGVIDTVVTTTYQHVHHNVCHLLYQMSTQPRTQVVYITSRPLFVAASTRKFLDHVSQEESRLPQGPILGFGGNFLQLVMMELVSKTTHHFKSVTLWKQVVQPSRRASRKHNHKLFIAGFGNTIMDMQAYFAVGMDLNRMFKINQRSEIVTFDKYSGNETTIEISELITENDVGNDKIFLKFASRRWFKDRMGTMYAGYSDPRLLSLLVNPSGLLKEEEPSRVAED